MLTAKQSIEPLSKIFPTANVPNISTALIAGGTWPRSVKRGKCVELLTSTDMAHGAIALSINKPLRKLANTTRQYGALRSPSGQSVVDFLAGVLDLFRAAKREHDNGVDDSDTIRAANRALRFRVAINCDFPSVTLARETQDGTTEEVTFGPIQQRLAKSVCAVKSTTITGHVLLALSLALYADPT